jgi:hypothetical protein
MHGLSSFTNISSLNSKLAECNHKAILFKEKKRKENKGPSCESIMKLNSLNFFSGNEKRYCRKVLQKYFKNASVEPLFVEN